MTPPVAGGAAKCDRTSAVSVSSSDRRVVAEGVLRAAGDRGRVRLDADRERHGCGRCGTRGRLRERDDPVGSRPRDRRKRRSRRLCRCGSSASKRGAVRPTGLRGEPPGQVGPDRHAAGRPLARASSIAAYCGTIVARSGSGMPAHGSTSNCTASNGAAAGHRSPIAPRVTAGSPIRSRRRAPTTAYARRVEGVDRLGQPGGERALVGRPRHGEVDRAQLVLLRERDEGGRLELRAWPRPRASVAGSIGLPHAHMLVMAEGAESFGAVLHRARPGSGGHERPIPRPSRPRAHSRPPLSTRNTHGTPFVGSSPQLRVCSALILSVAARTRPRRRSGTCAGVVAP